MIRQLLSKYEINREISDIFFWPPQKIRTLAMTLEQDLNNLLRKNWQYYVIHTHKVENISEDSLDLIPSPSLSVKIQIMGGKGVKTKHCWVLSTNF